MEEKLLLLNNGNFSGRVIFINKPNIIPEDYNLIFTASKLKDKELFLLFYKAIKVKKEIFPKHYLLTKPKNSSSFFPCDIERVIPCDDYDAVVFYFNGKDRVLTCPFSPDVVPKITEQGNIEYLERVKVIFT